MEGVSQLLALSLQRSCAMISSWAQRDFSWAVGHMPRTLQRSKGTGYGASFTAKAWCKVDGTTT